MEVDNIQTEIQSELCAIIKLLGIIQFELNELNNLSKPGGPLDVAVKEGMAATNFLTKLDGLSLKPDIEHLYNPQNNQVDNTIE